MQHTKKQLHVNEPVLHRQRKRQKRYDNGVGDPFAFDSPMLYYRTMHFQCIYAAVTTIQDQFHQHDCSLYSMMEQLLIKATTNGDYSMELKEITDFYPTDFSKSDLQSQLQLSSCMDIKPSTNSITFKDIHNHFQFLPTL